MQHVPIYSWYIQLAEMSPWKATAIFTRNRTDCLRCATNLLGKSREAELVLSTTEEARRLARPGSDCFSTSSWGKMSSWSVPGEVYLWIWSSCRRRPQERCQLLDRLCTPRGPCICGPWWPVRYSLPDSLMPRTLACTCDMRPVKPVVITEPKVFCSNLMYRSRLVYPATNTFKVIVIPTAIPANSPICND